MPKRPPPPPSSPAALRREIAALRRRVAAAERRAEHCNQHCQRAVQELDVYKEEGRHQTDELLATQHALEASRDRYAGLYDFAPVAYLTLDRSGLVEELNLPAAALLGVDRPRVLKLPFLSFVAPDDRKLYLKHLLRCRREGGHVITELHVVPRRAKPLPVLMSTWTGARPGSDGSDAAPLELRTALLDLSDRRRAEQQERFYQQRLRSLAAELSLAEERERRRIAVEIHDQISQSLAMAKMKLDAAHTQLVVPEVKQAVRAVAGIVEEVLGHTRSLTFELSPPVLHELGFQPAVEWLAERAQQQYGIRVEIDAPGVPLAITHELAVLLFQAARELLANVVKHADAARIIVRLRRTHRQIQLLVEDDGRGFTGGDDHLRTHRPAPRDGRDTGFGLFSIRTRLEHYGGSLTIASPPHGGSRVTLTVPIDDDGSGEGDSSHPTRRGRGKRGGRRIGRSRP